MIYFLMLFHFIGDFLCQPRWAAENKSHSWRALLAHVAIYIAVLIIGVGLMSLYWPNSWEVVGLFILVNFLLHLGVDKVSSQWTKKFYEEENNYLFFATIGFDQYLHFVCLAATAQVILK